METTVNLYTGSIQKQSWDGCLYQSSFPSYGTRSAWKAAEKSPVERGLELQKLKAPAGYGREAAGLQQRGGVGR